MTTALPPERPTEADPEVPAPAPSEPHDVAPTRAARDPGHEAGIVLGAFVALAVVGASVAMALEQLGGNWVQAFVTANVLSPRSRNVLLAAIGVGGVLGAGVAAMLLKVGRGHGAARLVLVARLAAPLVLAGLVPGLLAIDGHTDTLNLCLTLAAFLLLLEPLFRLSFAAWEEAVASAPADSLLARSRAGLRALAQRLPPVVRRHGPALAVGAAVLFYAVYMGFFTVRSHHKFNTYNWDLAHYDNEFWNDLHGRPFRNSLLFRNAPWANVRNHFQPTTWALVPFYALYPHAESLLVLQAVIIALGAIPLYRFAARRLPGGLAAALAVAYLLYPPTHGLQFFDFHWQPIAAVLLLAAWDCLDGGRMRLFWLFFVLALGCREDVSAGAAVIGLALLLAGPRPRRRVGGAIFGVSVVYFVALRFFIMPAVGAWGFAELYKQLFPEGEPNFVGIVRTLITNPLFTFRTLLTPDKLRYTLQLLLPLAFLPVRRAYLALSLVPGGFFTLLTTQYTATLEINFQYSGAFVGYIFPASALALAVLGQGEGGTVRRRAAAAALIVATLLSTAQWGAIPPRGRFRSSYGWISFDAPTADERQRLHDLEEMVRMVPPQASLAASDREVPHVSNRREAWNLAAGHDGADYVLYTTVNAIQPDLEQGAAAEREGYTRIAQRPGLILLKRPGAP